MKNSTEKLNSTIQCVLMNFYSNQKPFFTFMNKYHQIPLMKIKKVPLYRAYSLNILFLQFCAKLRTGCTACLGMTNIRNENTQLFFCFTTDFWQAFCFSAG